MTEMTHTNDPYKSVNRDDNRDDKRVNNPAHHVVWLEEHGGTETEEVSVSVRTWDE